MADAWNPETYHKFKDERSQPFHDLLAMVGPRPGMRVLDLGCGPGELTELLHQRLGARETVGLDSSENMLAKTRSKEGKGLRFVPGSIEDFSLDGKFDLIFTNAALQWVDDHPALLARLAGMLAPGGQIAMQVPYNEDSEFHAAARDVAAEFRGPLSGFVRHLIALPPMEYARLLFGLGFAEQSVVLRIYPHVLPSLRAVADWYRGSLLTSYESRLDQETFTRFVNRYEEVLRERFADIKPFFFPFPRILLWAKLAEQKASA